MDESRFELTIKEDFDPIEAWIFHELMQNRSVEFTVLGRSMWPWIKAGERVMIRPHDGDHVCIGQVVLCWSPKAVVGERLSPLHRIIWLNSQQIFSKGDALPLLDLAYDRTQVIGVMDDLKPSLSCLKNNKKFLVSLWIRRMMSIGPLWPIAVGVSLGVGIILRYRHLGVRE